MRNIHRLQDNTEIYNVPLGSYVPYVRRNSHALHIAPIVRNIGQNSVISRLSATIKCNIADIPRGTIISVVKINKRGSVELMEDKTSRIEQGNGEFHVRFYNWELIDRRDKDYYLYVTNDGSGHTSPFVVQVEISYSYMSLRS
jgi:hypothetical protein